MRIAIYVQDMRASGVVRSMIAIAREMAGGSDEIIILAGYASGIFGRDDVLPAGFVAAAERPARRLPRLAVVPHLRRTLRELRADVILSGGNFGHFSLWAATRGLGVPIVFVFSNAMARAGQPWRNRWRRVWSGLLVRASARTIVVGADMARDAVFRGHVARGRAVLIRNGIDLSRIPATSGGVPEPMRGTEPVILSIGRLQPQKNFEGLIDAVAFANRTRAVRLVVLGTGADDYRLSLLARAQALGIGDRVLFPGVTDNVFDWLRCADVFALASHWEGSSIALLEAMAADTPIVASRSAGDAADVLDHGRYGVIVDPGDTQGFADALLRQIDAPIRPGERVRAFDATAMVRAYHDLLTAAADRRSPRAPDRPPAGEAPTAERPGRSAA